MGYLDVQALKLVDTARAGEWEEILANTRGMLAAATADDWDRVVALEAERRARIKGFFAAAVAPYESAWVRDGIQEILESDRKLLAMSQDRKQDRSRRVVELRRGSAANDAYSRTAAG